ncbi:hypothetical protein ACHAWF_001279 [Thalassiosira exigua]
MSSQNASIAAAASTTLLFGAAWLFAQAKRSANSGLDAEPSINKDSDSVPTVVQGKDTDASYDSDESSLVDLSVLSCIRNRRSIFPNAFKKNPPPLDESIIQSLLDAALYGPFHGKCYSGNQHPARFVLLGKEAMVDMQYMTLEFYDINWEEHWTSEAEYKKWRKTTHDEIKGRWGGVSYMIAITMRRQAGPKRFPEWEEAAAVACAVQNMHIQSTKFKELACYWSSWHGAARDSAEMKEFLGMRGEDKCMGFFIVAHAKNPHCTVRRVRDRSLMDVEWRS